MDLALPTTDDGDLAYAIDALQLPCDPLVGSLSQLAHADLFAANGQEQDGDGARVNLGDDRLINTRGELAEHRIDLVAHVLSRDINLFVEHKLYDDLRNTFAGHRLQRIDTGDLIDCAFNLVGDVSLDFVRSGTRQGRRDDHHRNVDVGELIDT